MNMFHSISASSRGKGAYLLSALFVVLTGAALFVFTDGAFAQSAAPSVPAPASGVPRALPADHLIDVLNKAKANLNPSDASAFSGTVKIGGATEAAVAALEIAGSITIQKGNSLKLLTTSGNERGVLFAQEASPNLIIRTSGSENIAFQDGTDTNLFVQGSNGNVGIGKADPQRNLHVYGTSGNLMKIENNGTGNAVLEIQSDDNRQTAINFLNSAEVARGQLAYDQATGTMTLRTAGEERIRIDAQGRVGIGTPAPDSKLDISGFLKAGGVAADKNPLVVMAGSKAFPSSDQTRNNWSTNGAYWASPMIYRSIREPNDATGAFPDNEYGELMLQGTSHGSGYNRGISFITTPNDTTNPAIRMRIDPSGNVGIGTGVASNSLGYNLQVRGSTMIENLSSTGYATFRGRADQTYGWELDAFGSSFPATSDSYGTGPNGVALVNVNNAPLALGTDNKGRFFILGNGNVGIGTKDPATSTDIGEAKLLEIEHTKNSILGLQATASNNYDVRFSLAALTDDGSATSYKRAAIQVDSAHDLTFLTNRTIRAAILKTGEFQIGTVDSQSPAPLAQLLVEQASSSQNDVFRVQRKGESIVSDLLVNKNGVVGIGSSVPDPNVTGAKLYVNGTISGSKYCLGNDSNKCVDDWNDFINWKNNENDIYNDNPGNVGIGTITPQSKLHVSGANNYGVAIGRGGGGGNTIDGTLNNSVNQSLWLNALAKADIIMVPTDGKVGIGTPTPSGKLTVQGYAAGGTIRVYPQINGTESSISFKVNANSSNPEWNESWTLGQNSWGVGAGNFGIGGNGALRMAILNNGYVGIGTPTPGSKLHVVGSAFFDQGADCCGIFFRQENAGRLRVGAAWGTPGLYSEDNQDIVLGVAGGKKALIGSSGNFMTVQGDGRVGIGTTDFETGVPNNSAGKLAVQNGAGRSAVMSIGKSDGQGNAGGSALGGILRLVPPHHTGGTWNTFAADNDPVVGSAYLKTFYGPTNVLTLVHDGKVGIGTENPLAKLQVNDGSEEIFRANGYDKTNIWEKGAVSIGGSKISKLQFEVHNQNFHRMAFQELRFWDWSYGDDMVIFRDGNVGIGLPAPYEICPQCRLDVKGGDINVAYLDAKKIAELSEKTKIAYETDRIGLDVAELFESEEEVEVGDIVVVAESNRKLKKSSARYQGTIVGVVSGAPALLFEGSQLKLGSNPNRFERGTKPPVALAGRIPVKVSPENGSIKPGDYLTSSSKPGVAMRATEPGMTIGVALESYAGSGDGKILVFLNLGEKNTSAVIKELQQSEQETKGLLKSLERRLRLLEYKPLW